MAIEMIENELPYLDEKRSTDERDADAQEARRAPSGAQVLRILGRVSLDGRVESGDGGRVA